MNLFCNSYLRTGMRLCIGEPFVHFMFAVVWRRFFFFFLSFRFVFLRSLSLLLLLSSLLCTLRTHCYRYTEQTLLCGQNQWASPRGYKKIFIYTSFVRSFVRLSAFNAWKMFTNMITKTVTIGSQTDFMFRNICSEMIHQQNENSLMFTSSCCYTKFSIYRGIQHFMRRQLILIVILFQS